MTASSDTQAPRGGRLVRIARYFWTMFPLHVNLPGAVLMFYSFYLLAQATSGAPIRIGVDSLFGVATLFIAMLFTRILDDLKDEDVDPELFPDRPLVTGAIRYSDIRLLGLLSIFAMLGLNLGRGVATEAFLIYFVWIVLTWHYFLFPSVVADNIGLVLITHQPLVPLGLLYVYAVHLHTSGAPAQIGTAALLIVTYWIPMFAWEVGRKIRAPEEETEYLTYTRRWGTRLAPTIPLVGCLTTGALFSFIGWRFEFSTAFILYQAGVALLAAALIGRFVLRPKKKTNLVRPAVEGYLILMHGGLVGAVLYRHGFGIFAGS